MIVDKATKYDIARLYQCVNGPSQLQPPCIRITLAPGAVLPERKTAGAVGYDLCALEEVVIAAGRTVRIRTGVSLALPVGWEAQVRPRSSLSAAGVFCPVGTIDSDYRGD